MQAFALSTPLYPYPLQQSRSPSICPHTPLLSSISRARATLHHDDDRASDSTVAPAMIATANIPPQDTIPDKSPVAPNQIEAVRTQMEFWFSPSNLRRDWFLRKQMDPDGWLDPSVFLMFNKIKSLNADINDIILACKTSDELEVSFPTADSFGDDIAQTRVRRSPELPSFTSDYDMEFERSFIVSGLPNGCNVDSLLATFSRLAPVSYARIYRNKNFPDSPRALLVFADPQAATTVYESFTQNVPEGCEGMRLRKRFRPGDRVAEQEELRPPPILVCELNGLPTDWTWRTMHRHLAAMFAEESATRGNLRFLMYTEGSDHCYVSVTCNDFVKTLLDKMEMEGIMVGGKIVSLRLLKDDDELAEYWRSAKEFEAVRKARKEERLRTAESSQQSLMQRNPVGVIVKVDGLSPDTRWRQLRAELGQMGNLVYLSREGQSEVCFARYGTAAEAQEVVETLTKERGGKRICGFYVDANILEGEEEVEYWTNAEEIVRRKQAKSKGLTNDDFEDGGRGADEDVNE